MGAGHDPGDSGHAAHNHGAGASTRRLAIALGLTTTFLVVELIGAFVFDSLALLSDAAHMFTDSAALAIALAAVKIGQRAPDDQRTFGYRRFEILAAAFNAVLLFAVAGYVLIEGIGRFFAPKPVESLGMLIVATVGLIVNLVAMRILAGGKEDSLNVKEPISKSGPTCLAHLASLALPSRSISQSSTGSTRSSPSQSAFGCCLERGRCCAIRRTSSCRACRVVLISKRSARP